MAQAALIDSKLRLVFEVGTDENGKTLYKTKTLNNVKPEATTEQLFLTAQALGALCNDPITTVERNDSSDIMA